MRADQVRLDPALPAEKRTSLLGRRLWLNHAVVRAVYVAKCCCGVVPVWSRDRRHPGQRRERARLAPRRDRKVSPQWLRPLTIPDQLTTDLVRAGTRGNPVEVERTLIARDTTLRASGSCSPSPWSRFRCSGAASLRSYPDADAGSLPLPGPPGAFSARRLHKCILVLNLAIRSPTLCVGSRPARTTPLCASWGSSWVV